MPASPVPLKLTMLRCAVRSHLFPVLNFDQFMGVVQATGADPYLVLNFDSCNLIYGSGDWSYTQLGQLAVSWAQYIARKGYSVRARSLQSGQQHACVVLLHAMHPTVSMSRCVRARHAV